MSPATVSIRTKTEQMWDVILPFFNWLVRKEPMQERKDSNLGCNFKTEAEIAERIHMLLVFHRLPLTVEIKVEALQ